MKAIARVACMLLLAYASLPSLIAQNTFPATGNVGIGNLNPGTLLDVGSATVLASVPSNSAIAGLQVRTSSASTNINIGSSFYTEQTAASNATLGTAQFYTIASHPSGTIPRAIPVIAVYNQTGNGSVGDVRMFQAVGSLGTGSGSATNWYSFAGSTSNTGTGVITNAYGLFLSAFSGNITNKYGVYVNDPVANNYFGGSISIGTTNPQGYQLAVNGSAIFTKAVVKLQANWPDYVFKKDYVLPSLKSVEAYVKANNHLPGLPTAAEVGQNGVDLGSNQALLLKKIEELTLYTIQLQKQVEAENKNTASLQQQIDELKKNLKK